MVRSGTLGNLQKKRFAVVACPEKHAIEIPPDFSRCFMDGDPASRADDGLQFCFLQVFLRDGRRQAFLSDLRLCRIDSVDLFFERSHARGKLAFFSDIFAGKSLFSAFYAALIGDFSRLAGFYD